MATNHTADMPWTLWSLSLCVLAMRSVLFGTAMLMIEFTAAGMPGAPDVMTVIVGAPILIGSAVFTDELAGMLAAALERLERS